MNNDSIPATENKHKTKRYLAEYSIRNSSLPATTRLVLFVMWQVADWNTGRLHAGHAVIAEMCGLTPRAVRTHLGIARKAGAVTWTTPTRKEQREGRQFCTYALSVIGDEYKEHKDEYKEGGRNDVPRGVGTTFRGGRNDVPTNQSVINKGKHSKELLEGTTFRGGRNQVPTNQSKDNQSKDNQSEEQGRNYVPTSPRHQVPTLSPFASKENSVVTEHSSVPDETPASPFATGGNHVPAGKIARGNPQCSVCGELSSANECPETEVHGENYRWFCGDCESEQIGMRFVGRGKSYPFYWCIACVPEPAIPAEYLSE